MRRVEFDTKKNRFLKLRCLVPSDSICESRKPYRLDFCITSINLQATHKTRTSAYRAVTEEPVPKSGRFSTTRNRPLMNYPYATFYLEAQRARRNLLHVFEAVTDVPVAGPFLLAAKCSPAQPRKKKADSRLNLSELLGIHVNS